MTSIEGAGFKQLELIAARLRVAGDGRLKNRLRASVRSVTTPLIDDVRSAARRDLPKSGGLNEWVATGRFTTSTRLTASLVGVRIIRAGLMDGDTATFRHPVFAKGPDRKAWTWREQKLDMAWFYTTLAERAPEKTVPAIRAVFEQIALEITRG